MAHLTRSDSHPGESYVRPPQTRPSPVKHVFAHEHMAHFYDAPGEYGWVMEGQAHGFSAVSVITTETWPGGGPPLHRHDVEEAQVVLAGRYRVLIGEERHDVTGPAIVRIPAGIPHTFVNLADEPLHLIGVFPAGTIPYDEIGPNPLLAELDLDPPPGGSAGPDGDES